MAQPLTPQEQEELRVVLSPAFQEPQTQALLTALDRVALARANSVTRQDFHSLRETVAQLAEGQQALQQEVAQLVKGQQTLQEGQRTLEEGQRILQEAMTGLVRSHQELVAAQARTEERLGRVEEQGKRTEERLGRVEEQGKRTEEQVGRVEEQGKRTEERVGRLEESMARLATAQTRTEHALQRLARQVGGLSETVGGDIEDISYIVLHDVLQREFGWRVGTLERVWQQWNGEPVEVNIFGHAADPTRPDQIIWIVGEAKHNLTLREVNCFAKVLAVARAHLEGTIFPVCFCYRARPEVQQRVHELDIRLVFSYGRLLT